jgi:transketolase
LSSTGKKVFAVSPACFLTTRGLEQIKNDVAYSDQPVKVIGISAGVSYGALGSTHHSLHDYAALRAINNIDIVAPADNFETREAIKAAVDYPRPIYIRFGKRPMYNLHQSDQKFEIGQAIVLTSGSDVTFIATGEPVSRALMAAQQLQQEGITGRVISMHTVKPLDEAALLDAASATKAIITVEEHSVHGGLGSACAEVLAQNNAWVPFKIVGIPDEYTVTGSQVDIFKHYGITPERLAEVARKLLRNGA